MNKILVVEDDLFTKNFYELLFGKAGFKVNIFENGDSVFNFLASNQVDLIILDINLKNTFLNGEKIDGLILAEKLKKNEKYSNIPILIVTALNRTQEIRIAESGKHFDAIMIKPIVKFNDLINKINELVNKNDWQNSPDG